MNDIDAVSKMSNKIFDVNEFARLCSRTSPIDLAPIKERLENKTLEYEMITLLERLSGIVRKLDDIKKFSFYGKVTPYIENVFKNGLDSVSISQYNEKNIQVVHSVLGIVTEGGELVEMLLNHLKNGYPIDEINFVEELGDVEWYVAEGSKAVNIPMSSILGIVIAKLQKRFPEKYNNESAIIRDLTSERMLLERAVNNEL